MAVVKSKLQGLGLAILGWIGAIVSCALPMWKVFIWETMTTKHTIWEGIWKRCEDSTGEKQCKIQDYSTLSSDLQAAGALCIIVIVIGVLGLLLIVRAMCCDQSKLYAVMLVSGCTFIFAAVLLLIPVCWTAFSTIKAIFNPDIGPGLKTGKVPKQLGASLYLGFASSALLFGGGTILCCNRIPDGVRTVVEKVGTELLSQAS